MPGVSRTTVGSLRRGRRDVAQSVEQFLAVIFHRPDPIFGEERRENPLHRLAIFEHVGNARGAARIVLEHEIIAVAIANQVGPANVDVNIARHIEVHELRPKMRRFPDDLLRDHPVAQDVLPVIDVVQKKIERGDTLGSPRSTRSHSCAGMMRGIRSNGKIRSVPWSSL